MPEKIMGCYFFLICGTFFLPLFIRLGIGEAILLFLINYEPG
jgi:hypothetical protein